MCINTKLKIPQFLLSLVKVWEKKFFLRNCVVVNYSSSFVWLDSLNLGKGNLEPLWSQVKVHLSRSPVWKWEKVQQIWFFSLHFNFLNRKFIHIVQHSRYQRVKSLSLLFTGFFSQRESMFESLKWPSRDVLCICMGTFVYQIRSDQISRSVVSNSLRPHESQHIFPFKYDLEPLV